jgi:CO/xanthine dehydrogenase FAD-binding subunit
MPVAMIALDAQMHFLTADGQSVVISAEDFFKNNARSENLFTHVVIIKDASSKLAYRRVRKMSDVDQPLLTLSVKTSFKSKQWTNTRVVVNSGTSFAQRDYTLEGFLNGKDSKEALGLEAMNYLTTTIYDTRSNEYKQHMFRISIQRSIEELCKSN